MPPQPPHVSHINAPKEKRVLFFIIAISIFLLIIDSYNAGKIFNAGGDLLSQAWLNIARDVAFLSISLALVFFQFFRNLFTIIRRSL